jgi:hypothetical protein
MFSVIIKRKTTNLFGDFISCELVVCYYNNGMIQRDKEILKNHMIDDLVLKDKMLCREGAHYHSCLTYDLEFKNNFTPKKIFTGHKVKSSYITSIQYLGDQLHDEWFSVFWEILEKYILFKCVMEKDVALEIVRMVCLLGYYTI